MKNSVGAVMENQQLERLRNEMEAGFMSIRVSIAESNKSLHERLDRTDERIDQTNERIDQTNERLDRTNNRIDQIDERLDRTNSRIDQIDEKVAITNERIELINDKVDQTFSRLDENQQSLSARLITFEHKVSYFMSGTTEQLTRLERGFEHLSAQVFRLEAQLGEVNAKLVAHDRSIYRLTSRVIDLIVWQRGYKPMTDEGSDHDGRPEPGDGGNGDERF